MTSSEDRYRTLLVASSAIADQPTVKAVLHSLRGLLSSTSRLHGVELYVLSDDEKSLHIYEFDRDEDGPAIKTGAKLLRVGAVAQALDEGRPRFLSDVSQEMLKHPDLAPFAPEVVGRSTYLFPLLTAQKRYGILAVTKLAGQEFVSEDVELLSSLAAHVAIALECALARDRAEQSEREAARERDRLRLLLEINNHIVSKLEIGDLFVSLARSLSQHFRNDLTALWLLNKQTGNLERAFLDFADGKGYLEKVRVTVPTKIFDEWWRLGKPQFYLPSDDKLPPDLRDAKIAESIRSCMVVPLVSVNGPVGALAMDSRRENAFLDSDRDLLSQIGTQISLVLDNALAYGRLRASHDELEDQRLYLESEISSEFNSEDIVGKSIAIQNVLKQVAIVAPTDSTVLLHGETGTGKELFARAIHRSSPRRDRTFVKLNCAAIPSGLLESELFGHERGAFTGALMQKKGRFEIADRGTLFLDEIGDISMELQPKLLRAVQEQEFERLGSTKTLTVNVRLIAATHRNIPEMIQKNQFREDLFYRLNVFPIEIPPLRERPGDIPLLVHYFVARFARRMHKEIRTIPKSAMDALNIASWPGNVRELENFIERAVILTQGSELNVPTAQLRRPSILVPQPNSVSPFHQAERQAIIDALKATAGRIAGADGAAGRLGLKRTTLQNKIRKLNISRADYSSSAEN